MNPNAGPPRGIPACGALPRRLRATPSLSLSLESIGPPRISCSSSSSHAGLVGRSSPARKGPSTPTLPARARYMDELDEVDDSDPERGRGPSPRFVGSGFGAGAEGDCEGERDESYEIVGEFCDDDDDDELLDELDELADDEGDEGRMTAAATLSSGPPVPAEGARAASFAARAAAFIDPVCSGGACCTTASCAGTPTSVDGSGSLNLILCRCAGKGNDQRRGPSSGQQRRQLLRTSLTSGTRSTIRTTRTAEAHRGREGTYVLA